jgi:threonine dehydrogenase-like Zn-dependent dehydrogenase
VRAVICHQAVLTVEDVPDLIPQQGQVLLEVARCGICGSDLHARVHCDETAADAAELGYQHFMRSTDRVVMGHEFVGTVAEYGPRTRKLFPIGARVVALPILSSNGAAHLTGLSPLAPGGYAEQVLAVPSMAIRVPDDVDTEAAALTEPLAVALHAVRRGDVGARDTAVVIGCGPIGLAVIAMLKATGVRHVIASDFSAGRRRLAETMGADIVVNPADDSPWSSFADSRRYSTEPVKLMEAGIKAMNRMRAVPFLPWAQIVRAASKAGGGPVVFECVGVPGMIEHVIGHAPVRSRVVVVGVCMGGDALRPSMAINKEIDLRFVLGYDPSEFRQTLKWIGSGKVNAQPLITGTVGLDGVPAAFEDLGDPERHAKILIDPRR